MISFVRKLAPPTILKTKRLHIEWAYPVFGLLKKWCVSNASLSSPKSSCSSPSARSHQPPTPGARGARRRRRTKSERAMPRATRRAARTDRHTASRKPPAPLVRDPTRSPSFKTNKSLHDEEEPSSTVNAQHIQWAVRTSTTKNTPPVSSTVVRSA